MGRSGCRLPGHNSSEAPVFPLHTNAHHSTGGLPQLRRCPCRVAPSRYSPCLSNTQSSGKPALSLQLPRRRRSRFTSRPKPLPCPAPRFPARGAGVQELLPLSSPGVPVEACVRGCQGPR